MRLRNRYLQRRGQTWHLVKRIPSGTCPNVSGYVRESLHTNDIEVARLRRDERLRELEAHWRGGLQTSSRAKQAIPASGAIEAFLKSAALKVTTRKLYEGVLKQLADRHHTLGEINRDAARELVQSYAATRSQKAVNNLVSAAKGLFSHHGIDPGVWSGFRVDAGVKATAKGVWTDEELHRLCHAGSARQWLKDAILIAAYSGLRRQEVCGFLYDAERDHLVVTLEVSKTESSLRRVPCHPLIRDAVHRLRSREMVDPQTLTKATQDLRDELGIPKCISVDGQIFKRDFHALRHTFASKLASQGTDESVIAHILGHKPLNVTARYARKVDPDFYRPIIEAVRYW